MGWSIGHDSRWGKYGRDIGYGVPATCDHLGCNAEIHRGLSYVCGSEPYGGEHGCGLFFCGSHLHFEERGDECPQLCERCAAQADPFEPTPDVREWVDWKLSDDSWARWRTENPEEVAAIRASLTNAAASAAHAAPVAPQPRDEPLPPPTTPTQRLNMGEDMRECPFCGCDAWIIEDRGDCGSEPLLYRPQCQMCGGGLGGFQYRDNAITAWNTRPRTEGRGDEPVAKIEDGARIAYRLGYQDGYVDGRWPEGYDGDEREAYAEIDGTAMSDGWQNLRETILSQFPSPIREPEISREALIKLLADHFGFRPHEQMAEDKSDLRGKIRDGYDVNEPTKSDLAEVADAILNLAPVGGRGEEGSSRADLSPASRSPDQNSAGGEG